jgi:hypothetical protein
MAKMPRTINTEDKKEARKSIRKIYEDIVSEDSTTDDSITTLTSKSGLDACLRPGYVSKLTSDTQIKDFDKDALYQAAANVDTLFKNAIEPWEFEMHEDRDNQALKTRHVLYAPMEYKGRILPVKITVKEYKEKMNKKINKLEKPDTKIYAIEVIDHDIEVK